MRLLRFMRGVCGVALLVGSASFFSAQAQEARQDMQAAAAIAAPQEDIILPRKKKRLTVDPYAAQGIGLGQGGIRLYPTLEIDTGLTSNVRRTATQPKADMALKLKPGLGFASDWSRHSWTGSLSADWLTYKDASGLSTLSGSTQTAFRLDILHTTQADFTAGYTLSQTGFGDSSLPGNALTPRTDRSFGASAGITHDFGGLKAGMTTGLARSLFDDVALSGGSTEINSDRNYWEPSLKLRGEWGQMGAHLRPFAEITYNPRLHDKTTDRNGQNRNSQGVALAAGLAIADGPIWSGDIAITDQLRSYADPALGTVNAPGLAGRITWRPTEITTIDANTSVALGETETKNIAATKTWTISVNATQAVRNNVNLLAATSLSLQDTGAGIDRTTTATLGLNWEVNPNMTAGVAYTGTWLASATAGASYDEQRVMTSIVLKK